MLRRTAASERFLAAARCAGLCATLSVSYGQLRKADDTLPAFRRMCFFRIYVCVILLKRKLPPSAAHADGKALKVLGPAVLNGVIYICASVKMAQIHFSALLKSCNVCEDVRTGRSTN